LPTSPVGPIPQHYYNLCIDNDYGTGVSSTLDTDFKNKWNVAGTVDMCLKRCYFGTETTATLPEYWQVTYIDEFKVICTYTKDRSQSVTKYNN
jgi:hypothetical protein